MQMAARREKKRTKNVFLIFNTLHRMKTNEVELFFSLLSFTQCSLLLFFYVVGNARLREELTIYIDLNFVIKTIR
jgi:hypothetical protein